jgi:predicted CoA-binding protein
METRKVIDLFLSDKKLAIAGVSHNPKKFGHILFKTAKEKGFSAIPINKKGGNIDGTQCLESVDAIAGDIRNLLIVTNKKDTAEIVSQAIAKGIPNIWIQNGCESADAIKIAQDNHVNLVSKQCFFMYASPTGIHKFHTTISKWFGGYIKSSSELKIAH